MGPGDKRGWWSNAARDNGLYFTRSNVTRIGGLSVSIFRIRWTLSTELAPTEVMDKDKV